MKKFVFVIACLLGSFVATAQTTDEPVVSYRAIQEPPVYPGCQGDAEALKKCFTQKVQMHLVRNFDTSLINNPAYNSVGTKLFILFTIGKEGTVKDVKVSRAPHPKLEQESIRVMQLLPQVTPGKVQGNPTAVKFVLPFKMTVNKN
jgi:protein TonB